MADPFGILGLTGTAEQLVRLIASLVDRHQAYKHNPSLSAELLRAYQHLASVAASLRDDPHLPLIVDPHRAILHGKLARVSTFVTATLHELQHESQHPKSALRSFATAVGDRSVLLERKAEVNRQLEAVEAASAHLNLFGKMHGGNGSSTGFRPCVMAPMNPSSVYIDLELRDGAETQDTCEKRVKAAVLEEDGDDHIGAFAVGQGGVGKSCALRAIAHDEEVGDRFSGGVYFMTLGQDANLDRLIQQLCTAVNAANGHRVAEKMIEVGKLDDVLALMKSWFCEHTCLFIFDDVWARNDIDKGILQQLSILGGRAIGTRGATSRILYSTRDEELTRLGRSIRFDTRDAHGRNAEKMLLQASGMGHDTEMDVRSAEAIREILEICAGLPLALNVAGTSIRYMMERGSGDVSKTLLLYVNTLRARDGKEISTKEPGDGYSSLRAMLKSSLEILDSEQRGDGVEVDWMSVMSFRKMHRGLCVMKKQDWIPLSVLCDLWDVDDDEKAERCAMQMNRVGVVDIEYRECAGLRVHDLTHDFALKEAEEHEGCVVWCEKVLEKYGGGGGVVEAAGRDRGSEGRDAKDAYIEENLYDLLMRTGRIEELRDLLLSARWVKKVLERKTALQFRHAVEGLKTYQSGLSVGGGSGGVYRIDKDSLCGMELILKAVRLSMRFCDESEAGMWFQLYARTMHKRHKWRSVDAFLSEIEELAPRPWVRPVSECLGRAGGNLLETVTLPDECYGQIAELRASSDGNRMGEGVVGCTWTVFGNLFVFKYHEGESLEFVRLDLRKESLISSTGEQSNEFSSSAVQHDTRTTEGSSLDVEVQQERRGMRGIGWLARLKKCFCSKAESRSSSSEASETAAESMRSDASGGKRVFAASVCGRGFCVAVSWGATVEVWRVREGDMMREFQVEGIATCLVLSSDGNVVACGCEDGGVMVWDVESGRQRGVRVRCGISSVASIGMNAEGRHVVCGSTDRSIRVWDGVTGNQVGETMTGHTDEVRTVGIGRDGGQVISGSNDETVRVWNAKTGMQVGQTMVGHRSSVLSVAMSGDEKRAISLGWDSELRVWDLETQSQIGETIQGEYYGRNMDVTMNEDGTWAVSGPYGSMLKVWNTETGGSAEKDISGHAGVVKCMSMSKNGKRVVSGSGDKSVRMWDTETGRQVGDPISEYSESVENVVISGDGARAVSRSWNGWVRFWNVRTGEEVGKGLPNGSGAVLSVAMSGNGEVAVFGFNDGMVRIYDAEKGERKQEALSGHKNVVRRVATCWDGKWVISGCDAGEVRIWETKTGRVIGGLIEGASDEQLGAVRDVGMSGNGERAISCSEGAGVMIWDVEGGIRIGDEGLNGSGKNAECVGICETGRMGVSGHADGKVVLWDARVGVQLGVALNGHDDYVRRVVMTANGGRALSQTYGSVKMWDTQSGEQVGGDISEDYGGRFQSVVMSHDGRAGILGMSDGRILRLDTEMGPQIGEALVGHTDEVNSLALSQDGKYAVSGSDDGSVRMWDMERRSQVNELFGHTGSVKEVAISDDGRRAVSGSVDGCVIAWDVESCRKVGKAMVHHTTRIWSILSVGISANGQYAISGSDDGRIRVWKADTGSEICDALCDGSGSVWCVAVTSNGKWGASGSSDGKIRVWNVETGLQAFEACDESRGIQNVAMNEAGTVVVSESGDDRITVWNVERGCCEERFLGARWECVRDGYVTTGKKSEVVGKAPFHVRVGDDDSMVIVLHRGDGTVSELARFEKSVRSLAVNYEYGIVAAGLWNGEVVILRMVS